MVKRPSSVGSVPPNDVLIAFKNVNDVNWPIVIGNVPLIALLLMSLQ